MEGENGMFQVPRILIVDDEKDEVDILVEVVESEGYRAAAAYGGDEALSIARNGDVDLITGHFRDCKGCRCGSDRRSRLGSARLYHQTL